MIRVAPECLGRGSEVGIFYSRYSCYIMLDMHGWFSLLLFKIITAIRAISPWGFDEASSLDISGIVGGKDLSRFRSFIENAKRELNEIP